MQASEQAGALHRRGVGVEPDQRHVDLLSQDLELKGANGVTTPGDNEPRRQEGENTQNFVDSPHSLTQNLR